MESGKVAAVPGGAPESLYETDFYAWTQDQTALLRAGDLANIDALNIMEELERLGRKEAAELRSRLRILLSHLLKAIYQPERATRSWTTTILNQRIAIADHIGDNPSLKSKLPSAFATAYNDARELAASETGLPLETFPAQPPFSCEEAISRRWTPGTVASNPDERQT